VTLDGVHDDEMPEPSDDLWPTGDPVLAALAEDLRIVASGPAPEPRPGLVAVMAQGSVRPPEPAGRKKMLVKTFLGSLAAKVALGVGLATASVAAAGATGVLPDAAQHAVASVVSAATPFSVPDPSSITGVTAAAEDPSGSTTTTSSTSTTVAGGTGSGPTTTVAGTDDNGGTGGTTAGQPDNHGACVSAIAKDKSATSDTENHGRVVSTVARSDCGKTSPSTTVPGSTTTSSTSTSTSSTVANSSRPSNSGPGNSGNAGNGNNGNGNGSGKGGKG